MPLGRAGISGHELHCYTLTGAQQEHSRNTAETQQEHSRNTAGTQSVSECPTTSHEVDVISYLLLPEFEQLLFMAVSE